LVVATMKPTDTNIAAFFGLHRKTIGNYKNGCKNKKKMYLALKEYFLKLDNFTQKVSEQ
jgi:hypothetical protein